jgi:CheY-like chemotaxis protein
MTKVILPPQDVFDLSFKVFHELMAKKVTEILLVSSPYDAFIMEEDGRLAERIIHEYRGLNLSRPPMLTWVSTACETFDALSQKKFDLVITMPLLDDMNAFDLGKKIRAQHPELPIMLMAHHTSRFLLEQRDQFKGAIDRLYVWRGNTDLLLALIKNVEDQLNVAYDTQRAMVRVIVLVEDSPLYYSSLLPLLYKEIVMQTQAVMEDSLNDEHRILRMRARPKILVAETYEEAEALVQQFRPYLLCVISDVRFPHQGRVDENAGVSLLRMIREEIPDLPLLNLSSEESNRDRAVKIPAVFLNKNSQTLHEEIRKFFETHLGFGDFVFQMPDGGEVARASNLRSMEKLLPSVPGASVFYHATRNHFSSWLMARSEILLATRLKPVKATDFETPEALKDYLVACIHERRKGRQRGIVTDFVSDDFDPDADFIKLGKGSLGGKARGLAFVTTLLKENPQLQKKFSEVAITVPNTLVISTECFDAFMLENDLVNLDTEGLTDARINETFLSARFPEWFRKDLATFLAQISYPLAIRSSSLLEDAQYQPFAGIYKTFMLPNRHPDPDERLDQLLRAIKLVYASTFLEVPRSFALSTQHRIEDEKMAVIIQKLNGSVWGDYFYPPLSGVAQSYNFYPMDHMKPEEGIAHIALGLGKTVVEGEQALRFSPRYPQFLPQFSTVEDILKNSQRFFFALKLSDTDAALDLDQDATLARLEISDFSDQLPVQYLSSLYDPNDQRIRDTSRGPGYRIITFASILKYQSFPLPEILSDILEMGRKGMGCPVEIEFAVNLPMGRPEAMPEFALLQIRPMALGQQHMEVEITEADRAGAVCFSTRALGNGIVTDIADIVYVRPDRCDPAKTLEMAAEIGKINAAIIKDNRRYLLVGPGRWGSRDRWLGIPVAWNDISGVASIVETKTETFQADPSQGSHFFHNITSMGISYITVANTRSDHLDWNWLQNLCPASETRFLCHVRLSSPLTIKVDGKSSKAVIFTGHENRQA